MVKTIFRDDLFAGKVALVTGGGSGIGLRTARELAALGATVALASRTMENLETAANEIRDAGGRAFPVECNIRDEDSVSACVDRVMEEAGGLHLLVNNAGGQFPSKAADMTLKGWNAVIETNLTGTFLMSQAVFNKAMRKGRGAIVNVIANMWNGFPMMAHTGAARAGVDNLTKSLAVEWARNGVRVNAVAPGVIKSSGLDKYGPDFQPMIRKLADNNQTNRLGTEAECAAAIIFLLSPAAAFITGETLRVDGGEPLYSPFCPPAKHGGSWTAGRPCDACLCVIGVKVSVANPCSRNFPMYQPALRAFLPVQ